MSELVATQRTSLEPGNVIAKAVQFFTTSKWRTQSQSEKIATFVGTPPIPVFMLLLTFLMFFPFVIPGVIMYIFVIRKMRRLQNIVVTCIAVDRGTEVTVTHTKMAKKMVAKFIDSLSM